MNKVSELKDISYFREKNKEAWNKNAHFWLSYHKPHISIQALLNSRIQYFCLAYDKPVQVLDIGCGSGWIADFMPSGMRYIGIDSSSFFIHKHQNSIKQLHSFIQLDIEKKLDEKELHNLKSDLIVCCLSLIEMPSLEVVFNNLKQLLNQDGKIFIIGLEPITELFRISDNYQTFKKYLFLYRNTSYPLVISKKILIDDHISDNNYHRILYSLKDYSYQSKRVGLKISEVEEVNLNNTDINAPIFQLIMLGNE